jgi:hypothetical protein
VNEKYILAESVDFKGKKFQGYEIQLDKKDKPSSSDDMADLIKFKHTPADGKDGSPDSSRWDSNHGTDKFVGLYTLESLVNGNSFVPIRIGLDRQKSPILTIVNLPLRQIQTISPATLDLKNSTAHVDSAIRGKVRINIALFRDSSPFWEAFGKLRSLALDIKATKHSEKPSIDSHAGQFFGAKTSNTLLAIQHGANTIARGLDKISVSHPELGGELSGHANTLSEISLALGKELVRVGELEKLPKPQRVKGRPAKRGLKLTSSSSDGEDQSDIEPLLNGEGPEDGEKDIKKEPKRRDQRNKNKNKSSKIDKTPFKCPSCNYEAAAEKTLKSHITRMHIK